MPWLKVTHRWNTGESEPTWLYVKDWNQFDDGHRDDLIAELKQTYEDLDGYRGVKVEAHIYPDQDYLLEEIEATQKKIEGYKHYLNMLLNTLERLQVEE